MHFADIRKYLGSRVFWLFVILLVGTSVAQASVSEFAANLQQIEVALESIDGNPEKPAFIKAADLDGDGSKELIVSVFAGSSPMGAGFVAVYKLSDRSDLRGWKKTILPDSKGTKFPNAATVADVNEDGRLDIIVPSGFLATTPFNAGQISWYENLGANHWKKHDVVVKQKLFYHHVELFDMNGDGIDDMLTVGERLGATEVQYFAGKGRGVFATRPVVIYQNALGSLPTIYDVNQDGRPDLISAQYFVEDCAAAWLENLGDGKWQKHFINRESGPSIQLSLIPNLISDGRAMAVLANHVNSADKPQGPKEGVFVMPIPEKKSDIYNLWPAKMISEGIKSRPSPPMMPQGAPGVFAWGDITGNGLIDIVVHGDGDPRAFLLEQVSSGQFETTVLIENVPQGGVEAADLDGDGNLEIIVSSYEANKLVILKRK